jgi:hypothetical protein
MTDFAQYLEVAFNLIMTIAIYMIYIKLTSIADMRCAFEPVVCVSVCTPLRQLPAIHFSFELSRIAVWVAKHHPTEKISIFVVIANQIDTAR